MYSILLTLHSLTRWLVLASLAFSTVRAGNGWLSQKAFSRLDNSTRHWTATLAHIQLIVGVLVYVKSPIVKFFWSDPAESTGHAESTFFGVYHLLLMLIAVVLVTIGSALAKRKSTDSDKFKTMLTWFGLSLLIILLAIPWPFSPLASRPYLRTF